MLKGAVKNQRQLLYFGQSLLLKEWLFFQRVKPTPWRERTVAPAIWLLFLSPSGAALVCKLAGSLCPGYTYSSLLGKSTWKVTFQKLEHCFHFFASVRTLGGQHHAVDVWGMTWSQTIAAQHYWSKVAANLPTWNTCGAPSSRWKHFWRGRAGSFGKGCSPAMSGTKHRWLKMLKTQ